MRKRTRSLRYTAIAPVLPPPAAGVPKCQVTHTPSWAPKTLKCEACAQALATTHLSLVANGKMLVRSFCAPCAEPHLPFFQGN